MRTAGGQVLRRYTVPSGANKGVVVAGCVGWGLLSGKAALDGLALWVIGAATVAFAGMLYLLGRLARRRQTVVSERGIAIGNGVRTHVLEWSRVDAVHVDVSADEPVKVCFRTRRPRMLPVAQLNPQYGCDVSHEAELLSQLWVAGRGEGWRPDPAVERLLRVEREQEFSRLFVASMGGGAAFLLTTVLMVVWVVSGGMPGWGPSMVAVIPAVVFVVLFAFLTVRRGRRLRA